MPFNLGSLFVRLTQRRILIKGGHTFVFKKECWRYIAFCGIELDSRNCLHWVNNCYLYKLSSTIAKLHASRAKPFTGDIYKTEFVIERVARLNLNLNTWMASQRRYESLLKKNLFKRIQKSWWRIMTQIEYF